jgi:hypothetical protein
LSTRASNGPRRTDFAHGYTNSNAGSNPGTVVEEVDVEDGVGSPLIVVVVVDEVASGMVDEVGAEEDVVVEVGSSDVSGRIVSPGAIVATGFVVVVSPEAERLVVPLAQAANRRPHASVPAIA